MRRAIAALLVTACTLPPPLTFPGASETTGPAGTLAPSSPPATLAPDPPIVVTITTTTAVATTAAPILTTSTSVVPTTHAPTTTVSIPPVPVVVGALTAEFIGLINQERTRRHVAPLAADTGLAAYALAWSVDMAATGNLSHSAIATLLGLWGIVGENVGTGGNVDAIWQALLNSPLHYANIVDPRFTHLGVGAIVSSTGVIWTAHVYAG